MRPDTRPIGSRLLVGRGIYEGGQDKFMEGAGAVMHRNFA